MEIKFVKLGKFKAAIINDDLFVYEPGKSVRHGYVSRNDAQVSLFRCASKILKEEFEKDFPTKSLHNSISKALYHAALNEAPMI
jgi:hypothetical protein